MILMIKVSCNQPAVTGKRTESYPIGLALKSVRTKVTANKLKLP